MKQLVEQGLVDRVVAFSSAMAQFVPAGLSLKLMDMVDVDSDKWAQYAPTQPWPLSWLYRREAEKLAEWENQAARSFNATFLVSQAEASLLKARAPDAVDRIHWFENGVDAFHFSPEHELPNPYPKGVMPIVFTGAMDYWPNVDAVRWFAETVFPRVKAALPDAVFFIVGSDPTETVQHLSRISGVTVTGTVPDVRPYLKHAACAVAPLRLARGVQNKVLEAMSMARPVVASPQATEGISAEVGLDLLEAGDEQSFAEQVIRVCEGLYPELGQHGRATVLRAYDWEKKSKPTGCLVMTPMTQTQTNLSLPVSHAGWRNAALLALALVAALIALFWPSFPLHGGNLGAIGNLHPWFPCDSDLAVAHLGAPPRSHVPAAGP